MLFVKSPKNLKIMEKNDRDILQVFFYKSNIVFVFVQIAFSRTNNLFGYTFYTTAISLKYFF